jgi:lipoprotein-anchoring transpeptidase ErfK/SrfK
MSRPVLILARLCALWLLFPPAAVAGGFAVPPPPAVLSPDLTEPWIVQMQPGSLRPFVSDPASPRRVGVAAAAAAAPAAGPPLDPAYLPRLVAYSGREPPGTVVIDTRRRYLFLVLAGGLARRYGVGVGRPGFAWAGTYAIARKAEWPGWTPPKAMVGREPWLPASMAGGPDNPLGARALYLGDSEFRIHGTSEPWTIGRAVSSGCIRMRNEDVIDLYDRVTVGTRVVVL